MLLLVTVFLHVRDGLFHQVDSLFSADGQISVNLSVERHLALDRLLPRRVAKDADQDRDNDQDGDKGGDQVDKSLKLAFTSQAIEEILIQFGLHASGISRHGRVLTKTVTDVLVAGVVNRLQRLQLGIFNRTLRGSKSNKFGLGDVAQHAALTDLRLH